MITISQRCCQRHELGTKVRAEIDGLFHVGVIVGRSHPVMSEWHYDVRDERGKITQLIPHRRTHAVEAPR